jgi:phosphotransferase system HPr-like phosphotransfer protein
VAAGPIWNFPESTAFNVFANTAGAPHGQDQRRMIIWALLTVSAMAQTVGQVVKIDEPAGTITIKDTNGQSVAYKPKDGLLFNAVKEGDNVSFTAAEENGQKVISKLEKR